MSIGSNIKNLREERKLTQEQVAEELGISRQAVHYTLRKAEETLRGYEDKLGLVSEYSRNLELADKARKILSGSGAIRKAEREELISIIAEITE